MSTQEPHHFCAQHYINLVTGVTSSPPFYRTMPVQRKLDKAVEKSARRLHLSLSLVLVLQRACEVRTSHAPVPRSVLGDAILSVCRGYHQAFAHWIREGCLVNLIVCLRAEEASVLVRQVVLDVGFHVHDALCQRNQRDRHDGDDHSDLGRADVVLGVGSEALVIRLDHDAEQQDNELRLQQRSSANEIRVPARRQLGTHNGKAVSYELSLGSDLDEVQPGGVVRLLAVGEHGEDEGQEGGQHNLRD